MVGPYGPGRRPRPFHAAGTDPAVPAPAPLTATANFPELHIEWLPDGKPNDVDGAWESMISVPEAVDHRGGVAEGSTKRGRQYELDRFVAGTAPLTLRTTTRIFDPEYTAGPYYGKLLPMKQLRVMATWAGVTYPVWRGFVTSWGTTVQDDKVFVTTIATKDAFERLERTKMPSSAWALEIQNDNPTAWFRLGESDTPRITDSSPNGNYGLYDNCQQGQQGLVVNDADGAVSFAHSLEERAVIQNPNLITEYPVTFSCMFEIDSTMPTGSKTIFSAFQSASPSDVNQTPLFVIYMVSSASGTPGNIVVTVDDGSTSNGTNTTGRYDDNKAHHLAVVLTGTSSTIYVDGVRDGTRTHASTASLPSPSPLGWVIGNYTDLLSGDYGFGANADGLGIDSQEVHRGTIDEVCIWDGTAVPATRIAAHALAAKSGWEGDDTGTRVSRFLDRIGWPAELRDISTGASTLGPANWSTGASTLAVMQGWADTELGGFFIGKDGKIVWRSRHYPLLNAKATQVQATFGDAHSGEVLQYDNNGLQTPRDETQIRNPVSASRTNGVSVTVSDDDLIANVYGDRTYDAPGTEDQHDASIRDRATWLLGRYKNESTRLAQLTISPQRDPDNLWPVVLGLEIGDRIRVKRTPSGMGGEIALEFIIESIEHKFSAKTLWTTTFVGSPVDPNVSSLPDVVTWYGTQGSFSTALTARSRDTQGYPFSTKSVWANAWPAGSAAYFSQLMSDGVLLISATPQTVNASEPTGTSLQFARWLPPTGNLTFETIPTSTGVTSPMSTVYPGLGGGDFEDALRHVVAGQERCVFSVGRTWNFFDHADGHYPTFVVATLQDDVWVYNPGLSKYPEDMKASNPTAATAIYKDVSFTVGGDTFTVTANRNTNEMALLDSSGHIFVCHYDDSSGDSQTSGAFTVMSENYALLGSYIVPNAEYPTGHSILVHPRTAQPIPGTNDVEVAYDVAEPGGGAAKPAGLVLTGATNSLASAPDSTDWNVTGLLQIAVRLRATDYTPAASSVLMAHNNGGINQRSWSFSLNTNGRLHFSASSAGTADNVNSDCNAAPGFTDGEEYWVGVEYNTGTGDLKFYQAAAVEAMPTAWSGWTQIGTTIAATVVTPFNSTALATIGANGAGGALFTGSIYRAVLMASGTVVADANFAPDGSPLATVSGTSYTDAQGHVWTVGSAAKIDTTIRPMTQEFRWDPTTNTISARSAPFRPDDDITENVEQFTVTPEGELVMARTFAGTNNGSPAIFAPTAGVRPAVSQWPANATWVSGGGTTHQWSMPVTPTQTISTFIGGQCRGVTYDSDDEIAYMAVGTSGLLALARSGTGPYTWTFQGQAATHFDDAAGRNAPLTPVLDTDRDVLWIPVQQTYTGSFPPASPPQLDQWVVGVRRRFWDAPLSECRYLILDDAYAGKLDHQLLAY